MIQKLEFINIETFHEWVRYEREIYLDTYDRLMKKDTPLFLDSIKLIGVNNLHHMIKFHQHILKNFLYFKERNILREYLFWLYRVNFYRDIDLEFLKNFFWIVFETSENYMHKTSIVQLKIIYEDILSDHNFYIKESKRTKHILDNEKEVSSFTTLLLEGNHKQAMETLDKKCTSLEEFYQFEESVFSPAMKKIGWLWETNHISVAKEHLASSTADDTLFKLLEKLQNKKSNNKKILISTAPSENHALGTKIISKILEKNGYELINLSSELLLKDIVKSIDKYKPDYVVFSATLTTSLYEIAVIVEEINTFKYQKGYKVIIGGNGFDQLLHPTRSIKADFYANSINELLHYLENSTH